MNIVRFATFAGAMLLLAACGATTPASGPTPVLSYEDAVGDVTGQVDAVGLSAVVSDRGLLVTVTLANAPAADWSARVYIDIDGSPATTGDATQFDSKVAGPVTVCDLDEIGADVYMELDYDLADDVAYATILGGTDDGDSGEFFTTFRLGELDGDGVSVLIPSRFLVFLPTIAEVAPAEARGWAWNPDPSSGDDVDCIPGGTFARPTPVI